MTLPALPPGRTPGRILGRFLADERGSMALEFALVVPAFLFVFLTTFELGMLMLRQVMLDRVLDLTVRHIRLGHFDTTADGGGGYARFHRELKLTMCQRTFKASEAECLRDLRLDMQTVDPRDWAATAADVTGTLDCADRAATESVPASTFRPGAMNQLVILRACEYFDPFFPNFLLGERLAEPAGYYALTSTTAYAVEPS